MDEQLSNCPKCEREFPSSATVCPFCGLIFAKWKGQVGRYPTLQPEQGTRADVHRQALIVGVALCAVVIVVAVLLYLRMRSRDEPRPLGATTTAEEEAAESGATRALGPATEPQSDFDISMDLNGSPRNVVWGADEFIIGNNERPWGLLRLKRDSEGKFEPAQKVVVREPTYSQAVNFWAFTWNGNEYVGYADGAYFDRLYKNVFTFHDPKNLRVTSHQRAPELLGGLVWDGSGYWAGTRRNTATSDEPAFLYRFDDKLRLKGKNEPPGVGCQGLAWDGTYLWWVDVFSDSIHLLKVEGDRPQLVHTYRTRLSYLSGVAFDGAHIWVAEYENNRLHRLNPVLQQAWARGDYQIGRYDQALAALQGVKAEEQPVSGKSRDELLRQLREDPSNTVATLRELVRLGARQQAIEVLEEMVRERDDSVSSRARSALESIGVTPGYDRYVNRSSVSEGDADALEVSAEIVGDRLRASWKLHFAADLFSGIGGAREAEVLFPTFAKYRVTVSGGSLNDTVTKEYDASPGDNIKSGEELASGLSGGAYSVAVFIHVQYVDGAGTNKVINRTIPSLKVGR